MPANRLRSIRLENINKSFGSLQANRNINLKIEPGRVLALLGENGAGKSTLMSILAGQLQPDSGRIFIDGKPVVLASTEDALKAGIGVVYQRVRLVESMTVAENVFLGRKGSFWVRAKTMRKRVQELADRLDIRIDPGAKVCELSMGEKQLVEILKLLYGNSDILVFDEPTAVLTSDESEILFDIMRLLAREGKGVVLVSHKLEEVMNVADDIVILRAGEVVDRVAVRNVGTAAELAARVIGRTLPPQVSYGQSTPKQIVLNVKGLSEKKLHSINLELRKGEILALVGIAGAGQKPLVEYICGLQKPAPDTVKILGKEWRDFYSGGAWDHELSYIPADRQGLATSEGLDLLDNFLLTTRDEFASGPWLDRERAREKMEQLIQEFEISTPGSEATPQQLSGGNLQKMVIAREFFRKPRLIVAEQPTQGLDVSAAEDIRNLLLKAREQAGILLVTGDLSEALALSDRIAVMYGGRIIDCIYRDDDEKIALIPQMMTGITS